MIAPDSQAVYLTVGRCATLYIYLSAAPEKRRLGNSPKAAFFVADTCGFLTMKPLLKDKPPRNALLAAPDVIL